MQEMAKIIKKNQKPSPPKIELMDGDFVRQSFDRSGSDTDIMKLDTNSNQSTVKDVNYKSICAEIVNELVNLVADSIFDISNEDG
tara:strand:- start:33 stop:287 length:255 start_codon:yes stop_codon:yes gene_type:complete